MADNKYGVGPNLPPAKGPPGPSGPIEIPVKPTKKNSGFIRAGVHDGKHRISGNPNAHRIGRKRK